jgi:hypothetical protein
VSTRDDQRYAEPSLQILREPYVGHGKLELLPKVAERQAFVAARTPKYQTHGVRG